MFGDQWVLPLIKDRAQSWKNEISSVIFQDRNADLLQQSLAGKTGIQIFTHLNADLVDAVNAAIDIEQRDAALFIQLDGFCAARRYIRKAGHLDKSSVL